MTTDELAREVERRTRRKINPSVLTVWAADLVDAVSLAATPDEEIIEAMVARAKGASQQQRGIRRPKGQKQSRRGK
jgi:hypothetical protein